ncbi:hypothetical protein A2U01_0114419, partial [Trifolium medium]|nr:hypothetical protein [Trifolium medium]
MKAIQENNHTTACDKTATTINGGTSKTTTVAVPSSNNILIMEGAHVEAEFKGEDLYGDWL